MKGQTFAVGLLWAHLLRGLDNLRVTSCELIVASASCELRVASASCELRVASWNLRVASWKVRVDFASCELRVEKCELRVAICELILRVASCELKIASCKRRVGICELKNASCEFSISASWNLRVENCELRFTSKYIKIINALFHWQTWASKMFKWGLCVCSHNYRLWTRPTLCAVMFTKT